MCIEAVTMCSSLKKIMAFEQYDVLFLTFDCFFDRLNADDGFFFIFDQAKFSLESHKSRISDSLFAASSIFVSSNESNAF